MLRLRLVTATAALRARLGAKSAAESYRETRLAVNVELQRLDDYLRRLDRIHKMDPRNWGVQGTASHVLHQLSEVNESLSSLPDPRSERGRMREARTHPGR